MDSSSDGSFAWTDASNDTVDSGDMVNDRMNKPHSEDESVSGKSYKKKLQEELFAQSNKVMQNKEQLHCNEPNRKRSDAPSETEPAQSPRNKKIKREPESDVDVSTSKYKMNGHNHSESHDSYDESYLNLEVKAEQHFAAPYPNKTKQNRNKSALNPDIQHDESNETTNKKSKRKSEGHSSEETELEDDKLNQLVREENEYNKMKTKKKKKKSKVREESTVLEETKPLQGEGEGEGEAIQGQFAEPESDATTQLESALEIKTKKKNKKRLSKSSTGDCKDEDTEKRNEPPVDKSASSNSLSESVKRTPRISERIQFEEESSDLESMQLEVETSHPSKKSSKLKTFLMDNLNLKTLTSKLKTDSVLTGEDEIWIIRCPKDVDIDAFQNKDITFEGKCKLKLNGQTYEGTVNQENGKMSILSSEQSNFVIKSFTVKGCLNLHKRIPKSHFQDDAIINNNQTNFIPLPETKCRHPLFGSNYRKAIKLSARVAERLNATSEAKTKKRRERTHSYCPENSDHSVSSSWRLKPDPSSECSAKSQLGANRDQALQAHKKNNKKRKYSEVIAPRKKKRMKHDLESAEAWDSEQAIEENLFNF